MHPTIIHVHRDGSIAFTKRIDDEKIAVAWPLDVRPNHGLHDALAFHQAWPDGAQPPQSIQLAPDQFLLILTRSHEKWAEETGDTTVIGSITWDTALSHQKMTETSLRYFGFLAPDLDQHS